MSAFCGEKTHNKLFVLRILCVTVLVFFAHPPGVSGQEHIPASSAPRESGHIGERFSLERLLTEAQENNPQIQAARQGWQAAKQIPSQASTLPDPQFTVQEVNVGSPRPFAGYTNSDFAYIGFGVSQDLPYPGKLRLKGEIAKREADVAQQQYESVRRSVLAGVKSAYFQLAYLSVTLGLLEERRPATNPGGEIRRCAIPIGHGKPTGTSTRTT